MCNYTYTLFACISLSVELADLIVLGSWVVVTGSSNALLMWNSLLMMLAPSEDGTLAGPSCICNTGASAVAIEPGRTHAQRALRRSAFVGCRH